MSWRSLCCVAVPEESTVVLDFSFLQLIDVPHCIFASERTLQILDLHTNRISELPRALFYCHQLTHLDLSDNQVKVMPPAIASLINLQNLNMSRNGLRAIPDNIKCCKQLTHVNVSVNPLEKLPDGFTQLIALEELHLSETFLEFLPANFGRLSKLRILDLSDNNINTLPLSMSRLTNLAQLDIGRNEFSDLPEVIGTLSELTDLMVDSNKIRFIPSYCGNLHRLRNLDCSNNSITWVAPEIEDCVNLTDFVLTANDIQALPEEIGNLKELTLLKLDDNSLTSVPSTIGKLAKLEELILSENSIQHLPPTIGLLRKLKIFMVDENRLVQLPSELCSCSSLRILSVRNNLIESLPSEIGHLTNARVINFTANRLRNLPISVLDLRHLSALWLSPNQATPLTTLQQEVDPTSGKMVCSSILFPQSNYPASISSGDQEQQATPHRNPERLHIRFAESADLHLPSPLTRAPTPYPKELRSMAKHARILSTRPLPSTTSTPPTVAVKVKTATVIKPVDALPDSDEHKSEVEENESPEESVEPMTNLDVKGDPQKSISEHEEMTEDEPLLYALEKATDSVTSLDFSPIVESAHQSNFLNETHIISAAGAGNSPHSSELLSSTPIRDTTLDFLPKVESAHKPHVLNVTYTICAAGAGDYSHSSGSLSSTPTLMETTLDLLPIVGSAYRPHHALNVTYTISAAENGNYSYSSELLSSTPTDRETTLSNTPKQDNNFNEKNITYQGNDSQAGSSFMSLISHYPSFTELPVKYSTPNEKTIEPTRPCVVNTVIGPPDISSDLLDQKYEEYTANGKETFTYSDEVDEAAGLEDLCCEEQFAKEPPPYHIAAIHSKQAAFFCGPIRVGNFMASPLKEKNCGDEDGAISLKNISVPLSSLNNIEEPMEKFGLHGINEMKQIETGIPKFISVSSQIPSLGIKQVAVDAKPSRMLQPGFLTAAFAKPVPPVAKAIEKPVSEGSNSDTQGPPRSRIPALATGKVALLPSTAPTTSWMFGQHKNPTVLPIMVVKNPDLGFSIGDRNSGELNCEMSENAGIYVSKVQAGGPAYHLLKPGDKILTVNGVDFGKISLLEASKILKNSNPIVNLMISRQK